MAAMHDEGEPKRLEDFVAYAKSGKVVTLHVNLKKDAYCQNLPAQWDASNKTERELYLLTGEFIFGTAGEIVTISKVYAYGSPDETRIEEEVNKTIANERLTGDYERLKKAGIGFNEEYF